MLLVTNLTRVAFISSCLLVLPDLHNYFLLNSALEGRGDLANFLRL